MEIPESVATFVDDGGIRRAVREIMDLGDSGVLEGLDWSELPRFYAAQLSARQLLSEWAIFSVHAWDAIWGGLLTHWTALSPDEQNAADCDASIDLTSLCDTTDDGLWFGRVFTKGAWSFYAAIAAVPAVGLKIKVACTSSSKSIRFSEIGVMDEIENWVPSTSVPLSSYTMEVALLREMAERSVAIADQQCGPRRKASNV